VSRAEVASYFRVNTTTVVDSGCRSRTTAGSGYATVVGHGGWLFLIFRRKNTHICNGMYDACTTLTKRLTY
jgi:hypothetical protein